MTRAWNWMLVLAVCAGSLVVPVNLAADRQQAPQAQPAPQAVPADLTALLAAPASEMRLVLTRYRADRTTLAGNYAGPSGAGGGRGGGRGGGGGAGAPTAAPPSQPVAVSPARLARLKRFDLDWQAALGKLNTARFSATATADLATLRTTIDANLKQIEADALTMAQVMPALPFATKIVALVEARIRVQDLNSQKAAETTMAIVKDVTTMRAALEAKAATAPALNKTVATQAADATASLRTALAEWFNFYNAYDPMFTWWMGMPFKHADTALQDYAAFLREKVAGADAQAPASPASVPPVTPAPAPPYASVPDLAEIVALPQDEMRDVVARFNSGRPGGRGGRGAAPAAAATPAAPNTEYYVGWLAALKTLDFDKLTRNAQVDYLYIRHASEAEIARAGTTIPPGPPRKADTSDIDGRPRGRAGLIQDLTDNMIPYTPEQLIALANREFEWCVEEMKKASRELGFGDDWKKAVEHTKNTYVPPGAQPRLIMDLLDEAVAYLRARDLITVPSVAAESMRMIMLSPQQQLTSPFFLGGAQILVSYPTNTMEYDARMQSMRGNNRGFARAVAFHEMIPGHNLVGYLNQRYADYRPSLRSGGPFYGEGWPLYWELTMYELGFHKTPEERVGALFWRMHRCARIMFSLNFHMGLWSPQESVDFLVEKVGHERDNATAEVRRSFESAQYRDQPLYQAAYLLGGLQLRGLRKQLVDSKIMTNKQFHDEIMRQGNMPMALIRLAVTRDRLTRDMDVNWKFYGDLPQK